jgi:phosphatidylinositol transfer protein SFH5
MSGKNEVEKQLAFEEFDKGINELIQKAQYCELYGYNLEKLSDSEEGKVIRERLLRKFLQANSYEIEPAKGQLLKTLKWRKTFKPLKAAFEETHSADLEKVGLVTNQSTNVTTWNLYGAVEDRQLIFGDLEKFLRWRVALMEQGISLLDLSKESQSSMAQVHDYFNVSFLRLDPSTKAASKAAIDLFQNYYPEFLNAKFFVNVPTFMQWMFAFVKPFLSKETVAKFHVVSNGINLASELGTWVPKNYGGKTESLDSIKVTEFEPKDASLLSPRSATIEKPVEPEQGESTEAVDPARVSETD